MTELLNSLAHRLVNLPRSAKMAIALFTDAVMCLICVWLAFYLRTGSVHGYRVGILTAMMLSILIAVPMFNLFGLYKAMFRYEGLSGGIAFAKACLFYGILYWSSLLFVDNVGSLIPRTIGLIQPCLLFLSIVISRVVARVWLSGEYQLLMRKDRLPRAVIYGAGNAGLQLLNALRAAKKVNVVAFVDDNPKLHGLFVEGVKVKSPKELAFIIDKYHAVEILLAIPSAPVSRRKEVVEEVSKLGVAVRMLPAMEEIASGKINVSSLKDVSIEELLGRDPVKPIPHLISKNITDKVVMVTGAGGSIGSELCRQIVKNKPKVLLLVERAEYSLYAIDQELREKLANGVEVIPFLADVKDYDRLHEIMKNWGVNTVYHAAAYKHVPMVEHNPLEGVRNNVFGTWTCARCARDCGVDNFVLISTDKAVRPTNVMGATKRLCELILQAMAKEAQDAGLTVGQDGHTLFTMVRFGNVLGSSGSVVPRFRQQIKEGGPITLTHKDIIRYFMTIPEASQLVIQAAAMANGGDVFVLDMGEPVRIADLAKRMIELSGFKVKDAEHPDGDIEIAITGLRPGEKLYEELLIKDNPMSTEHPRVFRAQEVMIPANELVGELKNLDDSLLKMNRNAVLDIVKKCVLEYKPTGGISDWVTLQEGA